jgi:hypothetical protein
MADTDTTVPDLPATPDLPVLIGLVVFLIFALLVVYGAATFAAYRTLFQRCLGLSTTAVVGVFVLSLVPGVNLVVYAPLLLLCGVMVLAGTCDDCEVAATPLKQQS